MNRSALIVSCMAILAAIAHCRKTDAGQSENDTPNLVTVTTNPPEGSYLGQVSSITFAFSQSVSGMETPGNISISGSGIGTSQVASVAPAGTNAFVVNFSGAVTNGGFQVRLSNIRNGENRSLVRDSFFYNIDTTNPVVSSAPAINSLLKSLASVDLTYSKPVTGAVVAANYSFSGAGAGTLAVSSVQPLGGNKFRLIVSGAPGTAGFSLFIQNVQDAEGRALSGSTLNFVGDVSGPTMIAAPASASVTAQPAPIEITFSEAVQSALQSSSYVLSGTGKGSLAVSGVTQLTTYRYRLTFSGTATGGSLVIQPTGVTDMAGNSVGSSLTYTIDLTAPTKTPSPVAGTTMSNLSQFDVTYSEAVTGANTPTNYVLTGAGAGSLVAQAVSPLGGNAYRITLSGVAASGAINVQIIGVSDAVGNALASPAFSYVADATPIYVVSTSPLAGASGTVVSTSVQFSLSEPVNCSTVNSGTAYIQGGVTATISCAASTITLTPTPKLNSGTQYSATVSGIQDQFGNAIAGPYTFSFTTATTSQSGTSGGDEAAAVVTDISGNIYVGGFTGSNLDGQTNAGLFDMFVTKYNSLGQKQWTRLWGGTTNDEVHHMVADNHGGIYAAGFGSGTGGARNAVILKYDANGNLVWARELGAQTYEANGLAIDPNGYIYTVGLASGGPTVFRAKLDTLGQTQWLVTETLPGYHNIRRMAIRNDGVMYYTGYGNTWAPGAPSCFIRQCDAYGNATNQMYLSGSNSIYCSGIGIAPDNTVMVTGWTSVALPGNVLIGGHDVFLAKYSATLSNIWIRQIGTTAHEEGYTLVLDSAGDAFFGAFGNASFYGNPYYGSYDILLGKMSSAGSLIWTRQVGSTGFDAPVSMTLGMDNVLSIVGYASGSIDAQNYAGGNDAFLLRYDNQGNKK